MENSPHKDIEYYSGDDYEDTVENFNKLNQENLQTNIIESNTEECGVIKSFQKLYAPSSADFDTFETEYEYQEKQTDPYLRILSLKKELIDSKEEIDDYVKHFQDNIFLRETENLPKVMQELDLYKTKIDAFINYGIFNGIVNEEDESEKNKEFTSLFQKYNSITNNILNQIKEKENSITNNGKSDEFGITYEIIANPEIEVLAKRINELEEIVNEVEKKIGNWEMFNHNESISTTLIKLLNFINTKMNEKYENKYQTFKDCGSTITQFLEKYREKLDSGSYYLKIKELYSILEMYEHFDQIFEYVKTRLKAIKEIYDTSDQFGSILKKLEDNIIKNETRLEKLITIYEETLTEFENLDSVLKEMNELDMKIQAKLV